MPNWYLVLEIYKRYLLRSRKINRITYGAKTNVFIDYLHYLIIHSTYTIVQNNYKLRVPIEAYNGLANL